MRARLEAAPAPLDRADAPIRDRLKEYVQADKLNDLTELVVQSGGQNDLLPQTSAAHSLINHPYDDGKRTMYKITVPEEIGFRKLHDQKGNEVWGNGDSIDSSTHFALRNLRTEVSFFTPVPAAWITT